MADNEISARDVIQEIKNVENSNSVIVTILRDALQDSRQDGKRKTITSWILIGMLLFCVTLSMLIQHNLVLSNEQTLKSLAETSEQRFYEFISQYELAGNTEITQEFEAEGTEGEITDINKIDLRK